MSAPPLGPTSPPPVETELQPKDFNWTKIEGQPPDLPEWCRFSAWQNGVTCVCSMLSFDVFPGDEAPSWVLSLSVSRLPRKPQPKDVARAVLAFIGPLDYCRALRDSGMLLRMPSSVRLALFALRAAKS